MHGPANPTISNPPAALQSKVKHDRRLQDMHRNTTADVWCTPQSLRQTFTGCLGKSPAMSVVHGLLHNSSFGHHILQLFYSILVQLSTSALYKYTKIIISHDISWFGGISRCCPAHLWEVLLGIGGPSFFIEERLASFGRARIETVLDMGSSIHSWKNQRCSKYESFEVGWSCECRSNQPTSHISYTPGLGNAVWSHRFPAHHFRCASDLMPRA